MYIYYTLPVSNHLVRSSSSDPLSSFNIDINHHHYHQKQKRKKNSPNFSYSTLYLLLEISIQLTNQSINQQNWIPPPQPKVHLGLLILFNYPHLISSIHPSIRPSPARLPVHLKSTSNKLYIHTNLPKLFDSARVFTQHWTPPLSFCQGWAFGGGYSSRVQSSPVE